MFGLDEAMKDNLDYLKESKNIIDELDSEFHYH